ncbi:F5/8 type C domain containing protein [Tritrichomonas foetus]|uniref:F5/8 type C domain containing protein n=1 Tax=Tritrichomonas foetus TaxID=1144522 RepID=A0A1J4K1Q2_9EUKA|nr:F5/8 type C domain containing protein [Tritrichomonas foetus]|eukprot:OHT03405.1 F5/8 type C domain containing protein [Tritrichomonas foetus]
MSINEPMLPRRFSLPGEDDDGGSAYQYGRTGSQHGVPLLGEDEFHAIDVRSHGNNGIEIPFNGDPFNGIISHLSAQCHDNPAKKGLVSISGNSINPNYTATLPHVLQKDWTGFWCSANEPNSYITIDFLEHRVKLTHYTLKSYNASSEWRHMKSWVIEGSNGTSWKEIHRIKRGNYLNGPYKVATFPVRNAAFYQTIRIKMIGPNHYGDYNLFLMGLEFFGVLE